MALAPTTLSDLAYTVRSVTSLAPQYTRKRHEWRWEGQLHSIDDHPAVIINDNDELQWYTHGQRDRPEHLGPAWIKNKMQIFTYYRAGVIHRDHGPAMITPDAEKWYSHGALHRVDGPAAIKKNGFDEWWWNGRYYDTFDLWGEAAKIDPELFTMLKLKYG